MATNFPTSLDSLTNPATSDQLNSPSHALQHTNANDAIEALEAKVGVDGSTVTTSHAYKIAQLESDIQNSAGDFIPLSVLGQPSGPAELNADGNLIVPENKIIIEGATADAHELTIQAPDVTSDITVTLPNAAGTLALTSDITTAVNNLVNSAPNTLDTLNELATALGNDANFATTTATSIGNKVSKAGGDVITSSLSSVIPLVLKGAASQTANIFEWQNSSGAVVGFINSAGFLKSNYVYTSGLVDISDNGAYLSLNSNGNNGSSVIATNRNAIQVPFAVKGFASQTANLQEWRNSSGTVLSAVNALGQGIFTNTTPIASSAVSQSITAVDYTSTTATYTYSATAQTILLGEYVKIAGVIPSGYNGTYQVTAVATVSDGTLYSFTISNSTNTAVTTGTGTVFPSASVSISTQNKSHTGLIIKAVSGQTASTMEIQDSAGNPVTWWDSSGGMTASQAVVSTLYSGGFMNTGNRGYFNATTFSPSVSPIVVRGTTSQSADLTQWQNNAGTVLANISSSGSFSNVGDAVMLNVFRTTDNAKIAYFKGASFALRIGSEVGQGAQIEGVDTSNGITSYQPIRLGGSTTALHTVGSTRLLIGSNGNVLVNGFTASTVGLSVKGAISQTANLQEWQNSTGSLVGYITPAGSAIWYGNSIVSGDLRVGTATYFGGALSVYARAASEVGTVVRGFASQTANLQEWQNSAGTMLASVESTGKFRLSSIETLPGTSTISILGNINAPYALGLGNISPFTGSAMLAVSTLNGGTTAVGVLVRGMDSQTGDLQQWQNSSGTVLSKIDSTGAMFTTTASANTNTTQVATTAYVQTELADLVNSAPATLDTLKELSDALGADANFATTVTNNLALKAPLASPALTGTPTAPTAAVGTDSTQVATTAFVIDQIDASTQPGALYQTTAPTSPEIGQIWIDSDDNVTVFDSNIIRRQPFTATAGQTNFVTTVPFIDGFEQVYFNGLLLLKTTDYTTSGTNTVILGSAAAVNDIIEVVTITNLNSVNTYTQAETDALLAANTSVAPLSISANTNLLAKKRYFVTSASALTLTLPASPALNDEIQILDASGNASTYNITVARNGRLINGNAGNLIIDNNGGWYTLLYTGATYGWKVG